MRSRRMTHVRGSNFVLRRRGCAKERLRRLMAHLQLP